MISQLNLKIWREIWLQRKFRGWNFFQLFGDELSYLRGRIGHSTMQRISERGLKQKQLRISLHRDHFWNFSWNANKKNRIFASTTESWEWDWPKMEKNIMKPAEIWTTLLLPTRVSPSSPTFSLETRHHVQKRQNFSSQTTKQTICSWYIHGYSGASPRAKEAV